MAVKNRWMQIIILSLLAVILPYSAKASTPTPFQNLLEDNGQSIIKGRILSSQNTIAADETILLGFEIDIANGWHIYGPHVEKTGLPVTLAWSAVNLSVTPSCWPEPAEQKYEKRIIFMAKATTQAGLRQSIGNIDLAYSFLACNAGNCIPQKGRLQRTITIARTGEFAEEEELQLLLNAESLLPLTDCQKPCSSEAAAADRRLEAEAEEKKIIKIQGTDSNTAISQAYNSTNPPQATNPDGTGQNLLPFWLALLLALGGGILLNFMPCVLPVISLKLFSLYQSRELLFGDRLKRALAFTAGIIVTLLGLALTIIIFQRLGYSFGWGFQFQHQTYVVVMAFILGVVAFNLFGIFEFSWTPAFTPALKGKARQQAGCLRQFSEGILTVAISTPCSAPLLAPAIGLAFKSPAPQIMTIFFTIGLGLAMPFFLLSLSPRFNRLLPKTGPWIDKLKTTLGFILFIFVIWLCSVIGSSWGLSAVTRILLFLLLTAFTLWLFGQYHRILLLLLIPVSALLIYFPKASDDDMVWEEYHPAKVTSALQQDRAVFVDFTADWCLTCQQNEKLALDSDDFKQLAKDKNILLLKADWTKKDDMIFEELKRYGKAGVPLYLYFSPHEPQSPVVLPEILTPELLISSLNRVK